jgi:tRNA(adenine34) deaminase
MTKGEQLLPADIAALRRSFDLARQARALGERPFGALIVSPEGHVLSEAICSPIASCDVTAHAEVSAIRALWKSTGGNPLAGLTMFASAEPCAMCAGAIYWAKINRLIFGLTERRLRELRNVAARTAAITIDCRTVLASGGHQVDVIGPILEDEAIEPHIDFWDEHTR